MFRKKENPGNGLKDEQELRRNIPEFLRIPYDVNIWLLQRKLETYLDVSFESKSMTIYLYPIGAWVSTSPNEIFFSLVSISSM